MIAGQGRAIFNRPRRFGNRRSQSDQSGGHRPPLQICVTCVFKIMRAFGGFGLGDEFFYGEVLGDEVHVLENPFWIDIEPTGEVSKLSLVDVDVPVAPSKLIAIGLNYADHIAEMKRTPLGTPLLWF